MEIPELLSNYIKNIAVNHPDIQHSDVDGAVAFAKDQLSDLLDGVFRTALKSEGVMMRFIEPQFRPFNDESEGMNTMIETGFSVLERILDFTNEAIDNAQKNCFKIIKEIIARMVYDSRNGNPLLQYALNQLQQGEWVISPIFFQNDGHWAGHIVTFKFQTEYIEDIDEAVNQTGWLDII
jgi:hypothetical protein